MKKFGFTSNTKTSPNKSYVSNNSALSNKSCTNSYSRKASLPIPDVSFRRQFNSSQTSNDLNNSVKNKDKIINSLLTVLKMPIVIENIYKSEEELVCLIKDNLNLVDFKHLEVNSINKFVDDLTEILKEKNKKVNKHEQIDDLEESNKSTIANKTIDYSKEEYRPRATSEEKFYRRRTIELVLEKPRGKSKGRLRFNLFNERKNKDFIFHEENQGDSSQNTQAELIEEISFRSKK